MSSTASFNQCIGTTKPMLMLEPKVATMDVYMPTSLPFLSNSLPTKFLKVMMASVCIHRPFDRVQLNVYTFSTRALVLGHHGTGTLISQLFLSI